MFPHSWQPSKLNIPNVLELEKKMEILEPQKFVFGANDLLFVVCKYLKEKEKK